MTRGEIWTVAGGGDYTGKPRPVVILQDDRFDATDSVTVCAFTTDPTDAPLFRLPVEPSEANGLDAPSRIMVDKITTVRRSRLRASVGRLDDDDLVRLNRAVAVFLGLAGAVRGRG
jgi:mRNA interferase MazF